MEHDMDYGHVGIWLFWVIGTLFLGVFIHDTCLPIEMRESNLQCSQVHLKYKEAVSWAEKQVWNERQSKIEDLIKQKMDN